jgi:hypothetical protein
MMQTTFSTPEVATVFDSYPESTRENLLFLRQLIYEVAAETEGVGEVEETLKWGQPSYLTPVSKSGTTIRIDQVAEQPGQYGMFVHCQTTLVDTYRSLYSDVLTFDGDRAILFTDGDPLPVDALKHCIQLALTYHKNK